MKIFPNTSECLLILVIYFIKTSMNEVTLGHSFDSP